MLKKIIVSILIPTFLMQVVGCYSSKEITIADLKNIKGNKLIRVVTFKAMSYTLQNPPGNNAYSWSLDENNIYIYSSWPKNIGNNQIKLVTDTAKIPLSSIRDIYISSFDAVNTILCVIGIAAIIGLIGLVFIIARSISFANIYNYSF